MAALTQLIAKSFGSVFGMITVTLRELRDGILLYYLFEKRIVPGRVRKDKGSETWRYGNYAYFPQTWPWLPGRSFRKSYI